MASAGRKEAPSASVVPGLGPTAMSQTLKSESLGARLARLESANGHGPAPSAAPPPASPGADHENPAIGACDRLLGLIELAGGLEARDRSLVDDAVRLPVIPFAAAQLRMRIRPAFVAGWPGFDPVHVALFGGTNSGKSTVLNVMLGGRSAVMNPTARYSQHPEAYRDPRTPDDWLDRCPSRFEGYARHVDAHPPRQSDESLEREGYIKGLGLHHAPTKPGVVYWDAPDFSTEQARIYLQAVMDAVALADVVVMAVTEESYADDRGLAYLRMLTNAGTSVIAVANKLPEGHDERKALVPDMQAKLAEHRRDPAGPPAGAFQTLPRARGNTPEERLKALLETEEAAAFREAIDEAAAGGADRKRRALAEAVEFIDRRLDDIFRPLAAEVDEADRWGRAVDRLASDEFLRRYRHDYLDGKGYGEFNRTLVRLMELLQLPHIGPAIAKLGEAVRTPFNLARAAINHVWNRFGVAKPKAAAKSPEHEILDRLLETWFAELKASAQALAAESGNPGWARTMARLDSQEFIDAVDEKFFEAYLQYRKDVEAQEAERARLIHQTIEQNPTLLHSLRVSKAVLDVGAIALVIKSGGLNWSDAVVGPVVAGIMHLLVEGGLRGFLETQKAALKTWQSERMRKIVEDCLATPAKDLFLGAASRDQVVSAREDFAVVKAEAMRAARGEAQS